MCDEDQQCPGQQKCCFNGCQNDCVAPSVFKVTVTKKDKCPKPWKGQDGFCDRRGDMCIKDKDCLRNAICCFNGCQNDCIQRPGKI